MPYVPDPTNAAQPVDTVDISTAAAEFRALKTFLKGGTPIDAAFVPALGFAGGSVGITYAKQQGYYIKYANLIFFTLTITLTSKGVSVGTAFIGGLPFVSKNEADNVVALAVANCDAFAAGVANIQAFVPVNANTISLNIFAAGAKTLMADTDFTNTSTLTISGCAIASS